MVFFIIINIDGVYHSKLLLMDFIQICLLVSFLQN